MIESLNDLILEQTKYSIDRDISLLLPESTWPTEILSFFILKPKYLRQHFVNLQ